MENSEPLIFKTTHHLWQIHNLGDFLPPEEISYFSRNCQRVLPIASDLLSPKTHRGFIEIVFIPQRNRYSKINLYPHLEPTPPLIQAEVPGFLVYEASRRHRVSPHIPALGLALSAIFSLDIRLGNFLFDEKVSYNSGPVPKRLADIRAARLMSQELHGPYYADESGFVTADFRNHTGFFFH